MLTSQRDSADYLVISDKSSKLTCTKASIWCITIGLLQNSTRGFGFDRVSGRNRVPQPPTSIRAFILSIWIAKGRKTWKILYQKRKRQRYIQTSLSIATCPVASLRGKYLLIRFLATTLCTFDSKKGQSFGKSPPQNDFK